MISIRRVTTGISAVSHEERTPLERQDRGLFRLSHKVDYGLFLVMELAKKFTKKQIEPLSLRTVADQNHLSFFFLQKIAGDLRNAGIIEATRGKNGGYILKKSPQQLTLREILEALEGPIAVMHCLPHQTETGVHTENQASCVREGWCGVRPGLNCINQILINTFEKTTLHHLLNS